MLRRAVTASSIIIGLCMFYTAPLRAQEDVSPEERPPAETPPEYVPPPESYSDPAENIAPAGTGADEEMPPPLSEASSRLAQSMMLRDPFWPVSYKPKAVVQPGKTAATPAAPVVETPQWDDAMKLLVVRGIMKTPAGYIANIDGQIIVQGETVSASYAGRKYTWKIESINASGVSFQRLQVFP